MRSLKMLFVTMLLIPAWLLLPGAPGAFANDADFKLKNKTGYQIDEVYVAPRSSTRWGKDLMGSSSLGDGETLTVTFPHGNGACAFDIKVKYHDDNSTAEWSNIDLCKYDIISLFWDARNQVTRAVGEYAGSPILRHGLCHLTRHGQAAGWSAGLYAASSRMSVITRSSWRNVLQTVTRLQNGA
ncbi:MAG: hypothetical protein EXR07_09380 [Acetobacteraceae bacterium]|nr:hypothetical protein [Acetobacteraceae bacterium]